MSRTKITIMTDDAKTSTLFAPLIEFPVGGDIDDVYYRAQVGMVMAHVLLSLSGGLIIEFHDSGTELYLRASAYSRNRL